MGPSPAERAIEQRGLAAVLDDIAALEAHQAECLKYAWRGWWARPEQLPPPGNWRFWICRWGRGAGKTRTGSEFVRAEVESGRARRVALVARTAADARDVLVEGPSGLLAVCPPWDRPVFEPSKRRLTWKSGAIATLYSADEPSLLRGPEHDLGWLDELASWTSLAETFGNFRLGLRYGTHPRAIITSTPRPLKFLSDLEAEPSSVTSVSSTFANQRNLPAEFLADIRRTYENTRLGQQEIFGEFLFDNPNALFKSSDIERARIRPADLPPLNRIVVGVDPSVAAQGDKDECGIIAAGLAMQKDSAGRPIPHVYVLDDRSGAFSPAEWARRVIRAYRDHRADRLIVEANQGQQLLIENLRAHGGANCAYQLVHAKRGKQLRAEPVAALYEQSRVHHVGVLPALEGQMTSWDPTGNGPSPDRVDALVYAVSALALGPQAPRVFRGSVEVPTAYGARGLWNRS